MVLGGSKTGLILYVENVAINALSAKLQVIIVLDLVLILLGTKLIIVNAKMGSIIWE